jgi:pimeloyl-ACP methyl ester carboxylesterase
MRRAIILAGALLMVVGSALRAQDMAGDWQTLIGKGPKPLRVVIQVAKAGAGGWTASLFSIDQKGFDRPLVAESVTMKDSVFTPAGTFRGILGANGSSLKGMWVQEGRTPQPMDFTRATRETSWRPPVPRDVRMILVDKDVSLEVLDWGGTGRPVVLLAGLGNTAHTFDEFAPKLTADFHVYAITRRGYGASSVPASGYSADRLGDDVLAVIDSLGLKKPVLIGHSIAGEELSSVGSRHPEKVAGLVYLDAGYAYAYADPSRSSTPPEQPAAPPAPPASTPPRSNAVGDAIRNGEQKYTAIRGPILAIYATPKSKTPDPADSAAASQANAFERGLPNARVVRIPYGDHFVFRSNEADVLREIRTFIAGLGAR